MTLLFFCSVGSFHRIFGIYPIKAFIGDYLSYFARKIELSFNYQSLFVLKSQNQYANMPKSLTVLGFTDHLVF